MHRLWYTKVYLSLSMSFNFSGPLASDLPSWSYLTRRKLFGYLLKVFATISFLNRLHLSWENRVVINVQFKLHSDIIHILNLYISLALDISTAHNVNIMTCTHMLTHTNTHTHIVTHAVAHTHTHNFKYFNFTNLYTTKWYIVTYQQLAFQESCHLVSAAGERLMS